MRKSVTGLMIVFAVVTLQPRAHASNIGFNFGFNVGNASAYVSPRVVIDKIRHLRDEERRYNLDDYNRGDRHKPSRPEWNDWRDGNGRAVREKPREVAWNCLDRHWESDCQD